MVEASFPLVEVGHACAVLCWGMAEVAGAPAQHCTSMTNWPNTIQCLGSDDIMSLGIKSSAFLRVEHAIARKFDTSSTSGYMGVKYFQEFGPIIFDMSSASGYMGAKYFQEFGL